MKNENMKPLIGIVDSGAPCEWIYASKLFRLVPEGVGEEAGKPDILGHGTYVHRVISQKNPNGCFLHAQIFQDRPVTSALQVAQAIRWLTEQKVDLICLSLGLTQDRSVLHEACIAAHAEGIILVSASPAQGKASYPASYPEVIAVTGDARCDDDEISLLRNGGNDVFGAWCASPEQKGQGNGGASIACARLTALIAEHMATSQTQATFDDVIKVLKSRIQFYGQERKGIKLG